MRSLILLLTACGGGPADVHPEIPHGGSIIIGRNDLRPVGADGANVPEKYRRLLDAVGLLSIGCTATHVGGGLALTAGHCFHADAAAQPLACDATVAWGWRGGGEPYLVSECGEVLAAESSASRDFAIFTVSPEPAASVAVDLESRPASGTLLTIFGHPGGRPLEWSQRCRLRRGPPLGFADSHFGHQCDTEPGSSGSAVLDDATLRAVGIHNGGGAGWNYGTYVRDTPLTPRAPTDVGGFRLLQTNAEADFVLPTGTEARLVLVARDATRSAFEDWWGVELADAVVFIDSGGAFPRLNGGETLDLVDPAGGRADGPTPPLDAGASWQRDGDAWVRAPATPGWVARAPSGGVFISEVADTHGTGAWRFEYVEIAVP